jgi:hypothetical protein
MLTLVAVEGATQLLAGLQTPVPQVDYILKSHVYGRLVPHQIADRYEDDPERIALASFSSFGRRASFATYEVTLRL